MHLSVRVLLACFGQRSCDPNNQCNWYEIHRPGRKVSYRPWTTRNNPFAPDRETIDPSKYLICPIACDDIQHENRRLRNERSDCLFGIPYRDKLSRERPRPRDDQSENITHY